jgi:GNAT superfamily N-acetyltransferase
MSTYRVRELQIGDRESLAAMLDDAGYPGWAEDYRTWREPQPRWNYDPVVHGPRVLVAVQEQIVIGMLQGDGPRDSSEEPWGHEIPAPHAMVGRLVTAIEHRGRGVATALMDAYGEWADKRGARSLVAWAWEGGTPDEVHARRAFFAAYGLRRLTHPDLYIMGAALTGRNGPTQ